MNNKEALIDYYRNIVVPTVDDFLNDDQNLRKAKLAIMVIYHLCDYSKIYNTNMTYNQLVKECDDLKYIKDACNATKHRILTKGPNFIQSSDQITTDEGFFTAPFGFGRFYGATSIYLSLDRSVDNKIDRYDILPLLEKVMKFWKNKIDFITQSL